MTDFGRRTGDMDTSVYDPDKDGVIETAQTEADMTKAEYDANDDGVVDDVPAHHGTHEDAGADEVAATGLVGRVNYVDRGDPAAWDFQAGDLTTDNTWRDLDLSAIVPAGTIAVMLKLNIQDDLVGSYFQIRKNGISNVHNAFTMRTQVADVTIDNVGFVAVDVNRVIEYRATNTTFTSIGILVRAYLI